MTAAVLASYKPPMELELRFYTRNLEEIPMFKKLCALEGDKTVEQSINFIKPDPKTKMNWIIKYPFAGGVKGKPHHSVKRVEMQSPPQNAVLNYAVVLSTEVDAGGLFDGQVVKEINPNLCTMARVKVRLSTQIDQWRVDITLLRQVTGADLEKLPAIKHEMLGPLSPGDFILKAPWDRAEKIELEVEWTGDRAPTQSDIDDILGRIFKVVDPSAPHVEQYQARVYQVAGFLYSGSQLEEYKMPGRHSVRDLYNKVVTLSKQQYFKEVFPHITDYYLLEKAEGIRTLLIADAPLLVALGDTMETLPLGSGEATGVAVADCEFVGGIYYVFDMIAWDGKSVAALPTAERVQYIQSFCELAGPLTRPKKMIRLTPRYQTEIREMWEGKHEYPVDGLVFTPVRGTYQLMKSHKWKPLSHNTIDFLVKAPPRPTVDAAGRTLLYLFVGIKWDSFRRMKLKRIPEYAEIFPSVPPDWFPIQFQPSDMPTAYRYWHTGPIEGVVDQVCELVWVDDTWHLKGVRHDRAADVARGRYFGNAFHVAEATWLLYKNPLLFEDLVSADAKHSYFKDSGGEKRPSAVFNNFVKAMLIRKYAARSDRLVDLMAGRGADMRKVADAGVRNALYVDSDAAALEELTNRKHHYKAGVKPLNNISTRLLNMRDPAPDLLRAIRGAGFDKPTVVMCNFAIHYLTDSVEMIRNFVDLVTALQPSYFFFTALNGRHVHKLVGPLAYGESYDMSDAAGKLQYSIRRKYLSKELEPAGQQIEVYLPFRGGEGIYSEFLVNFEFIASEFEARGWKIAVIQDFSKHLDDKGKPRVELSAADLQWIGLCSYCVLERT
jgi:hypothetical protein